MKRPTVSVVIPTYNRRACVVDAVDSVLGQTYTDYELIVIDDGSTDDTGALLAGYGERLRYIYQANAGVSAARNRGIEEARGEWVAFLDSDDEWAPDYLATVVAAAQAQPGLAAVSSDLLIEAGASSTTLFRLRGLPPFADRPKVVARPLVGMTHINCSPSATVARRDLLLKIGGFDTGLSLYEDLDLALRLSLEGGWCWIDRPLVKALRKTATGLSSAHRIDPARSPLALQYVYQRCLGLAGLTGAEKRTLRRLLAAQRLRLAEIAMAGGRRGAGPALWAAFTADPRPVTAAKCVLLGLLGADGYRRLRGRRAAGREFRRSDLETMVRREG